MSFLAPLFLIGAAAIGLPVLFHLIRRSVREKQLFSSLMFLQPSPPRLTRRSRLEHLLLLCLRCAAIVVLATAFARPFLRRPVPPENSPQAARRTLVLLDTSASMQRQNLWEQARQKVEEIARAANPQDELALFTFDRQMKPLVTFEDWKATPVSDRAGLVRNRIAGAKPSWAATWLDQALIEAAELISENGKDTSIGRREVVVISDLQEGSRLVSLQGHEWPKGVQVTAERVLPKKGGNAGLQALPDTGELNSPGQSGLRIRVSNAADSKHEQFRVHAEPVTGAELGAKAVEIYVPPGQSRTAQLQSITNVLMASRVSLEGDDEPFDNQLFIVPPKPTEHTILYLGADSESDPSGPLFFLKRALQDAGHEKIRILRQSASAPLSTTQLDAATLIICTSASREWQVGSLGTALDQGKTLLLAPTDPQSLTALAPLLGTTAFADHEHPTNGYAMLGEIDFRHPLFAPFADPRYSDFTKIHFWKYREIDCSAVTAAHVLARFDSGDPALVEVPRGKGHVFILASGWNPADSQLALSSKFVPLLYSLLELSGGVGAAPTPYVVGDTVALPASPAAASVQLPDRTSVQLASAETNFNQTLTPGVYTVASGEQPFSFAVNVDPSESRTAPLQVDELERLGVPLTKPIAAPQFASRSKVQMKNVELEARQKLWRWAIVIALILLAAETWLAGWTARRTTVQEETV